MRLFPPLKLVLSVCFLLFSLVSILEAQQISLPENFYDETIVGEWDRPLGIVFDENGQAYIWEKGGRVHVLNQAGDKLSEPLIDIREEVANWGDHGLLGFALDPGFEINGYYYLLYVVERNYLINHGQPGYDPTVELENEATIGRITRYTADPATNFSTTLSGSRKVLLGAAKENGIPILIPSHGVGTLAFGEDGTLLASAGDAGSYHSSDIGSAEETYYLQALEDGIIRPEDNVGALKALKISSLNGKVLRLDSKTGAGVPSNPFFDSAAPDAPQSKVWALGFRNPFRFIVVPETGSHNPAEGNPGVLMIGDVGSAKWEELNVAERGGLCFGWPHFEGMERHWGFSNQRAENKDAPNPLYGTGDCEQEFFHFYDLIRHDNSLEEPFFANPCDNFQEISDDYTFLHKPPSVAWSGLLWNPPPRTMVPGFDPENGKPKGYLIGEEATEIEGIHFPGFTSVPGFFYQGENFPESYQGLYFQADLSGWIRTFQMNDNYDLVKVDTFATWDDKGVTHITINPVDGSLYWCQVYSNEVHRISFGGNPPPVAKPAADRYYGPSPLTVSFDGTNSYDPDGSQISYKWDFDDGDTSTEPSPVHTFTGDNNNPKSFQVTLTVTDTAGLSRSTGVIISVNNHPPAVEITSVKDSSLYPLSGLTILPLEARVSDPEHTDEELTYVWETFLHHNNHYHPNESKNEVQSVVTIDPIGCGLEAYWYRARLTVTDAHGLSSYDEVEVFPYCGPAFFELDPLVAIAEEFRVKLSWSTQFEEDLLLFEVQRSPDYHFQAIGEVTAKGTTQSLENYSFLDENPEKGLNYYRLKLWNEAGIFEYSNIVAVDFQNRSNVSLFPNPADNELSLNILKTNSGRIVLDLFNAAGSKVMNLSWDATIGEEFFQRFRLNDLPQGVYYYQVTDGDQKTTKTLMIAR